MKCPKCQSQNLHQLNPDTIICRDCENVFTSQISLETHAKPISKPKNTFSPTKPTAKQYLITLVSFALVIGGFAFYVTRDPYICSKGNRERVKTKLRPMIETWEYAEKIASNTSRMNLSIPLNEMQVIQQAIRETEFPECAQIVQDDFLEMTEATIDSYLSFMSQEPDDVVTEKTSLANGRWISFLKSYDRMQKGESNNPMKTLQADIEEAKQASEEAQRRLNEFNNR